MNMDNSTVVGNKSNNTRPHASGSQDFTLAVNVLLAGMSLYIVTAAGFYQYTMIHRKDKHDIRHYKIARTLQIIFMVGMCFAHLHNVCRIIESVIETSACTLGIMWLVTYSFGILTAYVFLWQRQYWLYNNRIGVGHLVNRKLKAISWASLAFLALSAVMIFLSGSRMLFFSSCGEEGNSDSRKLNMYQTILSITLLVLTILGQALLLALFIIPLKKHENRLRSQIKSTESLGPLDCSTSENKVVRTPRPVKKTKMEKPSSILSLSRRCAKLAILSMLTDIAAATTTIWSTDDYGKLIYDMNVLINLLCCLGSFKNWKEIIFPWKNRKQAYNDKDMVTVTSMQSF